VAGIRFEGQKVWKVGETASHTRCGEKEAIACFKKKPGSAVSSRWSPTVMSVKSVVSYPPSLSLRAVFLQRKQKAM
jgi:hypothetical protein